MSHLGIETGYHNNFIIILYNILLYYYCAGDWVAKRGKEGSVWEAE
jgi:hypothetical protein